MRLPTGPMDGALPRKHVLSVLEEHGVTVAEKSGRFILSHDHFIEVQYLPEMLPRALVHHFARRFDIDPFMFWYEDYDDGPPQ